MLALYIVAFPGFMPAVGRDAEKQWEVFQQELHQRL